MTHQTEKRKRPKASPALKVIGKSTVLAEAFDDLLAIPTQADLDRADQLARKASRRTKELWGAEKWPK